MQIMIKVLGTALLLTNPAWGQQPHQDSRGDAQAQAELKNQSGETVGTVTLTQFAGGVLVRGELSALPPGWHAIHVHEVGTCEPPFESAGGHFNPGDYGHGLDEHQRHAGDLPNIWAHQDGTAAFEMITTHFALAAFQVAKDDAPAENTRASGAPSTSAVERGVIAEPPPLVFDHDGASIVVHAQADDYRTDPAGASGDRIACGVLNQQ
jgi:superoxide dismutase, Cu-Zn family